MKCEICNSTKFTIFRHIREEKDKSPNSIGVAYSIGCIEIKCEKGHNQPMPPPTGFIPDQEIEELYLGNQTKPHIRFTKLKGKEVRKEWL